MAVYVLLTEEFAECKLMERIRFEKVYVISGVNCKALGGKFHSGMSV